MPTCSQCTGLGVYIGGVTSIWVYYFSIVVESIREERDRKDKNLK